MSNPKPNPPREHAFESFPKPRTFPAQWDTSEIAGHSSPMATPPSEECMATFPKPRTIPEKWDVSGFSNQSE